MSAAIDTFDGFPKAGLTFLRGLARDNSKSYFDSHRDRYRSGLFEPTKAFVVDLGDWLDDRVAPGIVADPSVNGSMFRINRDISFSKDKTPYKTSIGMIFWLGASKKTSPLPYVGIDPRAGVTLGVGAHPIADIDGYRAAIADDFSGKKWSKAIAKARRAGDGALDVDGDALKRVPKPYDAEHPRADWLRYKSFHIGRTVPLPDELHSAAFVEWTGKRLRPYGDALTWLAENAT